MSMQSIRVARSALVSVLALSLVAACSNDGEQPGPSDPGFSVSSPSSQEPDPSDPSDPGSEQTTGPDDQAIPPAHDYDHSDEGLIEGEESVWNQGFTDYKLDEHENHDDTWEDPEASKAADAFITAWASREGSYKDWIAAMKPYATEYLLSAMYEGVMDLPAPQPGQGTVEQVIGGEYSRSYLWKVSSSERYTIVMVVDLDGAWKANKLS